MTKKFKNRHKTKKITDAKMLEKHIEMKNRQKAKIQRDLQRKRMTVFWSLRLLHVSELSISSL